MFELSRVRSLQQQLLASSRKRKLAEGLYVEEVESSTLAVVAPEAETYLQQLFMLMLAYAFAGVHPKVGATDASTKMLSADSTGFAQVPLDVMLALLPGPQDSPDDPSVEETGLAAAARRGRAR